MQLTKHDLETMGLVTKDGVRCFSIITIPTDPTLMTANLKAPIVIHVATRKARQVVLQDNSLAIREPIFTQLQQRVVQNPNSAIKNQAAYKEVAVKIKRPPEVEV